MGLEDIQKMMGERWAKNLGIPPDDIEWVKPDLNKWLDPKKEEGEMDDYDRWWLSIGENKRKDMLAMFFTEREAREYWEKNLIPKKVTQADKDREMEEWATKNGVALNWDWQDVVSGGIIIDKVMSGCRASLGDIHSPLLGGMLEAIAYVRRINDELAKGQHDECSVGFASGTKQNNRTDTAISGAMSAIKQVKKYREAELVGQRVAAIAGVMQPEEVAPVFCVGDRVSHEEYGLGTAIEGIWTHGLVLVDYDTDAAGIRHCKKWNTTISDLTNITRQLSTEVSTPSHVAQYFEGLEIIAHVGAGWCDPVKAKDAEEKLQRAIYADLKGTTHPVLCLRGCNQMVSADPVEQRRHWNSGKCVVPVPEEEQVDLEEQYKRQLYLMSKEDEYDTVEDFRQSWKKR